MISGPLVVIGICGAVCSLGMVISANTFYSKIGTYHPIRYLHNEKREETEPIPLKVFKLCVYNFIIAISVTGLMFVYTAFPIGGESLIGFTQGKALIIAAIVMNFSIRVGSLSKWTSNVIFDRAISFGYSFVLSIYFLSFFALSVYLLENQFSTEEIIIPSLDGSQIFVIVGLVIFGPILSTLVSELVLAMTGVDEDERDEFSRDELNIL